VIKYKSKEKKDKILEGKPKGSFATFVESAKSKLHLDRSCKGSPFQSHWVSLQILDGYL